jgi:thiamine-monophosphate kinase
MKTVGDIGEFGLIKTLAASIPRAGDDCAVLPSADPRKVLLYTCDPVVEGIHFLRNTPARQVGWKAMARNLSDIAAMGGLPRWGVVSIGLRPSTRVSYVEQLYAGLHAAARKFGCRIVGGDTTHVRHEQFVVVTVLGEVEKSRCALRSGAQLGDSVFVTGTLGGSLRGKHLTFTPRITEARWLTQHFHIHSMIDVSDGLGSDIYHLLKPGIGVELYGAEIPARGTVHAALYDGEDFELLFTVDPRDVTALRTKWKFPVKLTEIGRVVRAARTVAFIGHNGRKQFLRFRGYDHFAQRR